MTDRFAATSGALLGALGVILGAFGAHALKARLSAAELETYETAVRYQMYHALALLGAAWLISRNAPGAPAAAVLFLVGVALFSGSLYLYVATGVTTFAMVTPLGGLALIAGWVVMAWGAWKG